MILVDNSQVIIASLFHSLRQTNEIDESFLRHLILNSYRYYRNRFSKDYGELVICSDAGNYWRKDFYPQYKENRKKSQKKSDIDWGKFFEVVRNITEELKETFPYKFVNVPRTEADDVIATLCMKYGENEKIMIISSDKDFQQLQRYSNVRQYSPTKKDFLVCKNPEEYLLEHTIRGDVSDGIPNILSDDDTFINDDKRQMRMTKKRVEQIRDGSLDSEEIQKNWKRNQILVDFTHIPPNIIEEITNAYDIDPVGSRKQLLEYFIQHKLKNLMENIGEF